MGVPRDLTLLVSPRYKLLSLVLSFPLSLFLCSLCSIPRLLTSPSLFPDHCVSLFRSTLLCSPFFFLSFFLNPFCGWVVEERERIDAARSPKGKRFRTTRRNAVPKLRNAYSLVALFSELTGAEGHARELASRTRCSFSRWILFVQQCSVRFRMVLGWRVNFN